MPRLTIFEDHWQITVGLELIVFAAAILLFDPQMLKAGSQ